MLKKLFARHRSRRPAAAPRARLSLEALEAREVPYSFTWLGGFVSTGLGYDGGDARNWITDKPVFPPGSKMWTPGPADDVFYDGAVSHLACDMGSNGNISISFKSMSLSNNYQGTVTTRGLKQFEDLTLTSGNLNAWGPANGDLMVSDEFVWTGGVLNATAWPCSLQVMGGQGTITPPAGGLVTGSGLYFGPDGTGPDGGSKGTFNPGTVNFNNGAGVTVDSYSKVDINPAAGQPVVFQGTGGPINLPAGQARVLQENFQGNNMPVNITGGHLVLLAQVVATISGKVGGGATAGSVEMTAGKLDITHSATLKADSGVKITGGKLRTVIQPVPEQQVAAKIDGNLTVSGGEILPLDGFDRGAGPHSSATSRSRAM